MQRRIALMMFLSSFSLLRAYAQTSGRPPTAKTRPPREPSAIEQMDAEHEKEVEKKRNEIALRQQRKDNMAKLDKDLSGLIETAQKIQKDLRATNPETHLPVGLIRQSEQLEETAKQITKRFRNW